MSDNFNQEVSMLSIKIEANILSKLLTLIRQGFLKIVFSAGEGGQFDPLFISKEELV